MDNLIKKYTEFFFPDYVWDIEVEFPLGKIVFTKQAVEASTKKERENFIKTIKPTISDYFKTHKYKLQINVVQKHSGENSFFLYEYRPESNFLFDKMKEDAGTINYTSWFWPYDSSGTFWLNEIPEKDSI